MLPPAALVSALVLAGCLAAPARAEPLTSYDGWRPAAGDAHRHAGTAYSLLAASRVADEGPCPHEFGPAVEVYSWARKKGYDWLSLSYHVGVRGIVKPDRTPHQLSDSLSDPAFRWWIDASREPIPIEEFGYTILPQRAGFPDYVRGGTVSPPFNEALSLSSAAARSSVPGEFAAIAGREFTTASFVPRGGQPGDGGHKVLLFARPQAASCGVSTDPQASTTCSGETDVYRWVRDENGAAIQAHPGSLPKLVGYSRANRGGFTDKYVHGIEVGKSNAFQPAWELGFQKTLQIGYRLFPAYGSDQHHLGNVDTCSRGGPPQPAAGATVCWVEQIEPDAILAAMRARRCYYSRSHTPVVQIEGLPTDGTSPSPMGGTVHTSARSLRLRVWALNDPRNQREPPASHRFHRLEVVRVTTSGAEVVARCDAEGDDTCHCRAEAEDGRDRCVFDGAVPVERGAVYVRILEPEGPMKCVDPKQKECTGHPALAISAPVFVNQDR